METLAIDPGPTESGWVIWDGTRVVQSGVSDNDFVLAWLLHQARGKLLAIEMIRSYGMSVGASVFETCVWVGRFQQIGIMTGKRVILCYRPDVKIHHCKSPKAKDGNVRQALIDRIGEPGTKKNPGGTYGVKSHAWAALAVAVYARDLEDARAAGVVPF